MDQVLGVEVVGLRSGIQILVRTSLRLQYSYHFCYFCSLYVFWFFATVEEYKCFLFILIAKQRSGWFQAPLKMLLVLFVFCKEGQIVLCTYINKNMYIYIYIHTAYLKLIKTWSSLVMPSSSIIKPGKLQ